MLHWSILSAAVLSLVAWPIGPASAQAAVPLVPVERETVVDPVAEAAQRFDIPATWIRAIMRVESGGNVRALSAKGAMGLMQIMPETWSRLRERYALGGDPYDPRTNILAGTAYLREMFDRYGSPGFLAAYNAGPGRYDDYRASGLALPVETRTYLAALLPMIGDGAVGGTLVATPTARSWTMAPLFVVRSEDASVGKPSPSRCSSGRGGLRCRRLRTFRHPVPSGERATGPMCRWKDMAFGGSDGQDGKGD